MRSDGRVDGCAGCAGAAKRSSKRSGALHRGGRGASHRAACRRGTGRMMEGANVPNGFGGVEVAEAPSSDDIVGS